MNAQHGAKLGRISVLIAVIALLMVAAVYFCELSGVAAKIIDYDFLVYAALTAGLFGFFGACAALVALLKSESRRPAAYIGLTLNLVLVAVGSCFTLLI